MTFKKGGVIMDIFTETFIRLEELREEERMGIVNHLASKGFGVFKIS